MCFSFHSILFITLSPKYNKALNYLKLIDDLYLMRSEYAVLGILLIGLLVSVMSRSYAGVAIAALGIPLYLAYISREMNILAKSRLFDRDLFVMIGITIFIILLFEYLIDPRIGLITAAFLIPLSIWGWDRLKSRK